MSARTGGFTGPCRVLEQLRPAELRMVSFGLAPAFG